MSFHACTELEQTLYTMYMYMCEIVHVYVLQIFRNPIEQILRIGQNDVEESKRPVVYLTSDQTWALQDGIKLLKWLYMVNGLLY